MTKQPEASYDLPLLATTEDTTPAQKRAAALTCAHHATNHEDLTELLQMLGILKKEPTS